MDLIRLFLPVIWALVAAAIGRLLYATSSAFFEQMKRTQEEKKRLRLVGSVCIAAIVYLGLWQATPATLRVGVPADSVTVRRSDLHAATEELEQTKSAASELLACAALAPSSQCKNEIRAVQEKIDSSMNRIKALGR
jgi:hypothetical protein